MFHTSYQHSYISNLTTSYTWHEHSPFRPNPLHTLYHLLDFITHNFSLQCSSVRPNTQHTLHQHSSDRPNTFHTSHHHSSVTSHIITHLSDLTHFTPHVNTHLSNIATLQASTFLSDPTHFTSSKLCSMVKVSTRNEKVLCDSWELKLFFYLLSLPLPEPPQFLEGVLV